MQVGSHIASTSDQDVIDLGSDRTALPDKRAALLILGMHRSGTSALAGTLARLGAQTPRDLMEATSANEGGYYESDTLMMVDETVLASTGSTWHDWRPFRTDWLRTDAARQLKAKARTSFAQEFGEARLCLFKDPRVCRFIPFWTEVLAEDGIEPKAIIPFRAPVDVARSLHKRDRMSMEQGSLLWLRHVLDAERDSRTFERAFIDLNDFLRNWRGTMERVSRAIGVTWPRDRAQADPEIDAFLGKDLRHHSASAADLAGLHPWVGRTYRALQDLALDPASPSAFAELDDVRRTFDEASTVFGPMVKDRNFDGWSWRVRRRIKAAVGLIPKA